MTPSKTQPALLGGLAIGVLSALPVINIANCCCAWILFGGALAAYLMQQGHTEPITIGDGGIVGLLAGLVGAFVWLVISVPISIALSGFQASFMQQALRNSSDLSPQFREMLERMSSGGPAIGLGLVFGFFVMLCISSVFGMMGGLFGALIFRKNAPPPPPIPPVFPGTFAPPPIPGEERH